MFWKYAANLQENILAEVCSLRYGCPPVNLLHIFRTPFPRSTSGWLFLGFSDCFSWDLEMSKQTKQDLHCMKSVQIRSYFWSVFSCIWTEYRGIRTENNSLFGHFSRSGDIANCSVYLNWNNFVIILNIFL